MSKPLLILLCLGAALAQQHHYPGNFRWSNGMQQPSWDGQQGGGFGGRNGGGWQRNGGFGGSNGGYSPSHYFDGYYGHHGHHYGPYYGYQQERGGFGGPQWNNDWEMPNYDFWYQVRDQDSRVDMSHNEQRQGESSQGRYHVTLPDGRTQLIEYIADNSGYRPFVSYHDSNDNGGNNNVSGSLGSGGSGNRQSRK